MQKFTAYGQLIFDDISLRTSADEIFVGSYLREWRIVILAEFLIKYEENSHRGSNWTLFRVNDLELHNHHSYFVHLHIFSKSSTTTITTHHHQLRPSFQESGLLGKKVPKQAIINF